MGLTRRVGRVWCLLVVLWGGNGTLAAAELPKDTKWLTNDSDPVYASSAAKKGGTFNTFMMSFPLTLRTIGPDANGGFRSIIGDNDLALIGIHPNTDGIIPLLATHWAYGKDKKTMYFKINPAARWSDGQPVTADDFLFTLEFMRSKHIVDPWSNEYYTKRIADVQKIDDLTIAAVATKPEPELHLLYIDDLRPIPKHFYKKLEADFVRKYNWQIIPNTGPYYLSDVKKGKSVTLKRKADWWGQDLRFFKNRFNVDQVVMKVIRDINVAYEHFRKGSVEVFGLTMPEYWHDKSKIPEIEKGYIEKLWFYTGGPQSAVGLFLNEDHPILADRNVRLGLQHAVNVDKMLKTVLRGDYERLPQRWTGYGRFTDRSIKARPFDLKKADEYFKEAGWAQRGPDGIRTKAGKRLAFTITYGLEAHTPRLVFLKEEAKNAGVELNLQLLDGAAAFKKSQEKKHEIAWTGWSTGARPAAWEHYHSDNAHKPQTNNITNTDNKALDKLIVAYQDSLDAAELVKLAHKIQQLVHDDAGFIPTYMVPYFRIAYWRWWRLPEVAATKVADSSFELFHPTNGGLFWFDGERQAETQKAMKAGEALNPVTKIDTTYKGT